MQMPDAGNVENQSEDEAPLKAGIESSGVTIPDTETVDYGGTSERFPWPSCNQVLTDQHSWSIHLKYIHSSKAPVVQDGPESSEPTTAQGTAQNPVEVKTEVWQEQQSQEVPKKKFEPLRLNKSLDEMVQEEKNAARGASKASSKPQGQPSLDPALHDIIEIAKEVAEFSR